VPALLLLTRVAQWSAERRNAYVRRQTSRHDRQLNKMLAFSGTGE